MAIARFENEPSQDLEELHAFLTANKEGTFLEDVTLSLGPNIGGTNNAKLSFGSDLFIQCLGVNHSSDALSFTSITTCASCFLIISFKALGYVIVDDITHIRFVDTHTESNGSNYHVNFLIQESILVFRALDAVHSCMVR